MEVDSDAEGMLSPQEHGHLTVRSRENGRKRLSDAGGESSNTRRRTREPSPERDDGVDLEAYDPDQSMQERREIQRKMRQMQQQLREDPERFMQADGQELLKFLDESDRLIKNVKQTGEAAIDARGLVIAADISARRVQRLMSGNVGNGVDVDEFVSKCITFMRNGGGIENDDAVELTSTQRGRRRPSSRTMGGGEDDEVGDEGDMLSWPHLGKYAVIPFIKRPALPGFLMGPLSIEKKVRKMTQRAAPFKVSNLQEVRPQELKAEDLKKSDKNDLPSICRKIYERLEKAQGQAQDAVEAELDNVDEDDQAFAREVMDRHSLRANGGIDLVRFVINPHSFGQTVENLFYVSFLLREGTVKLDFDEDGLPSLEPVRKETFQQTQSRGSTRHQAIMSIDMDTWRDLIKTFDIREPMIPHREEEQTGGPGARGWYN
ncbi:hypothetical protein OQA88_6294 [Cercophora sp. LCS_1]